MTIEKDYEFYFCLPATFEATEKYIKMNMNSFASTSKQIHFADADIFNENFCELWQEPSEFILGKFAREESEICKPDAQLRSTSKLCRLCSFPAEETVYIYSEEGLKQGLPHKINSSLPITVSIGDPLPKQVCLPCVDKLNMMFKFSEGCVGIEEKLNLSVKSHFFRSKIILNKNLEARSACDNIEDLVQDKSTFKGDANAADNQTPDSNLGYSCPFCSYGKMVAYQNNSVVSSDNVQSYRRSDRFFYFYKDDKEQMWMKNSVSLEPNVPDVFCTTNLNNKQNAMLCFTSTSQDFGLNTWDTKNKITDLLENVSLNGILLKKTSCQLCGEIFQRFSLCQTHSRVHVDNNNFPCILCGICFCNEIEWMTHFEQQEMEKYKSLGSLCNFTCSDCSVRFNSFEAFDGHPCPHPKAYECKKCGKYFVSEIKLHFHVDYFHKQNNSNKENITSSPGKYIQDNISDFSCSQCLQNFEAELELIQHLQEVHNNLWPYPFRPHEPDLFGLQSESQTQMQSLRYGSFDVNINSLSTCPSKQSCYKCRVCNEIFLSPAFASAHLMQQACESADVTGVENVTLSVAYECEFCEKCFSTKFSLKQHYAVHGKECLYMCRYCNASFSSYNRAAKHRSSHTKGDTLSIATFFVCFECDTCFIRWAEIYQHRKKFHEQQNLECFSCKLTFDSITQLMEHINSFHCNMTGQENSQIRRRSYSCSVCGENFQLKGAYNKHQRKHGKIRPFECDLCGKSFTQNSGLYAHHRVHTGEKPYPCDFCERTFRLKHDRDNHHRCHTGERPFRCEYCGKAFRTSHDHRQHLLIHTGERPYCCGYCGKGFRRINGLNVHKRIHTGEKPYTCEICGRRFTQKGDMLKHCKSQHPQVSGNI